MAIRERLVYAIDVVTDGATNGLRGFKAAINDANTTAGKFKAGAGAAFESVKAHAGQLALGVGVGLVTAGIKASQQFTTLALDVEKFSQATGLSTEEASRWIEVAGDLGISTEQIQGGFVRLEKAIAGNSPAFKTLGIELQKTADGTVDVSATMLQAIRALDGVQDPMQRAKLASELFGRGFADMSELVLGDATAIKSALDDVSESKIIDQEEIEKAKKQREALDNLNDAVEDLSLALGETLTPALTAVAEGVTDFNEALEDFHIDDVISKTTQWGGKLKDLFPTFLNLKSQAEGLGRTFSKIFNVGGISEENKKLIDSWNDASEAAEGFDRSLLHGLTSFDAVHAAVLEQTGDLTAANIVAVEWAETNEEVAEVTEEVANVVGSYSDKLKALREAYDPATAAARLNKEATEKKAEADAEAAEAAQRHQDALEAVRDAMDAQRQSALDLVGGDIAVRDAQREAATAAAELSEALKENTDDLGAAGAAIDAAAQAQLEAASAAAEYRAKQMEANGQTVDARTKAQLMKEELQRLVGQLDGPLAAAIQRYIDQLGAIPSDVRTNLTVTTRQGDTGQIRTGGRAIGGPVSPGGLYEVNENGSTEVLQQGGRTFIIPSRNGRVTPAAAGASTSVTIINNRRDLTAADVAQAIQMAELAR
jgi:hypothetical protein